MRRMFVVLLAIVFIFGLCACGNENWGLGNYTYRHVHVCPGAEGYCATVNSWHDNELGAELHTQEFGSIYCSEGTYILFEDGSLCPFCRG